MERVPSTSPAVALTAHGNPVLGLREPAAAGQVVTVTDGRGRPVWRSHPLAAGCRAVSVDVRGGRFVGAASGWSVLPPGRFAAAGVDGAVEVTAVTRIEARFAAPPGKWLPAEVAWHTDGSWRGRDGAIAAGAGGGGGSAYLFVDGAMHGEITARFRAAGAGSAAAWGLIARHFNGSNHLRLVLRRAGNELAAALERVAAGADPEYRGRVLASARAACAPDGTGEVRWHFNGTRHQVALDGLPLLDAHDAYMGGVEVVGLFAEAGGSEPASEPAPAPAPPRAVPAAWRSFALVSSQWVARHLIRRGDYAAVVRPGNVHRLHLSPAPGARPAAFDPRTNVMWESGIQVGHVGGSEIKFTQGAALDLLACGEVADLVRWHGPLPRFVEQDDDVRGYARGTAAFFAERIVISDWVAVRVRRSVGPDFDLLGRALTAPARVALGSGRTFAAWELDGSGRVAELAAADGRHYYPFTLVFPLAVAGTAWHLIAVVGGLQHAGGLVPGRALGWQCPHGLTASHGMRVTPTVPGTEYGHWIAVSWLPTADTGAAEAAALALRDEFEQPASLTVERGALPGNDPAQEQPAAALTVEGAFDRALGAYRVTLDAGAARFRFDPGAICRRRPVFIASASAGAAAAGGAVLACALDGQPLLHGADYLCQRWPAGAAGAAHAVQLRADLTRPVTVELQVRAAPRS